MTLALAAALALGAPAPPPAIPGDEIAIVHVDVIPMDEERVLRDHTVIVRGDRIVAVDPSASSRVPAGARVIDGRGKWLVPGFVDMHAHLLSDDRIDERHAPAELAVMVANGVTTARIPIGRPGHLDLREATFAAKDTTIYANAIMGGIDIIVDAHTHVIVEGVGVMGAFDQARDKVEAQITADSPVLRVKGIALMAGVTVTRKSPPGQGRKKLLGGTH